MAEPNRWLHLRHPRGFTDERFEQFCAHCRTWIAYVRELLTNWSLLGPGRGLAPAYQFFEPELSQDRLTATLPLGGEQNLGSRALIEDGCSRLLWQFFPLDFIVDLEEGLTETLDRTAGPQTHWRRVLSPAS